MYRRSIKHYMYLSEQLYHSNIQCNCIRVIYLQDGRTALDVAVEKGHKDITEVLKIAQSKVRTPVPITWYSHDY